MSNLKHVTANPIWSRNCTPFRVNLCRQKVSCTE